MAGVLLEAGECLVSDRISFSYPVFCFALDGMVGKTISHSVPLDSST